MLVVPSKQRTSTRGLVLTRLVSIVGSLCIVKKMVRNIEESTVCLQCITEGLKMGSKTLRCGIGKYKLPISLEHLARVHQAHWRQLRANQGLHDRGELNDFVRIRLCSLSV
jgi:hypothetical protein